VGERRPPKAVLVQHRGDEPAKDVGDRLAWCLRRDGFTVDEVRAPDPTVDLDLDAAGGLSGVDVAIVGGSLLVPEVRRALAGFVTAHAGELTGCRSVLLVTRPGPTAESGRLRRARAELTAGLGWTPDLEILVGGVGGGRLRARRATATVDWDAAIEAFADRLVADVRARPRPATRPTAAAAG
jgi:hypothetical protein